MSEKDKALTAALSQIERSYGKGAIMKLGEAAAQRNIDVIPTGSLTLDMALGVGGIPRGRVVEIYGPESSGKTTLALHVIAQSQKLGGVAPFIDVDSVAALVPKAEIDGEMGDSHVALQARLMSQALRKLTGAISKSSTSVIFINQLREKVGIMFGNPEVTTGGRALKFYASIRLDIRKVDSIKNGLDVTGNRVKVKVVKNKVAPPFKSAEFDILYNEGISYWGSVLDAACDATLVEKAGSWFSCNGQRMGQGREQTVGFLKANPKLGEDLIAQLKALHTPEVRESANGAGPAT